MDALSYTTLGESNISSKLPEIAMRQYKIAEANREKTEKQHTDLISLFKYDVEGFNPDRTGLEAGYQAIIKEGSNIALKQGYSAAQQYVQTQKSLLDNISKMSTSQAEKYKILTKDFADSKKWGQATEDSRYKTGENLKKYTMANEYEPTKQDYDAVRKKYGYSSSIPNETLRPLVRQGLFGEGENILDFKSEVKLWDYEEIKKVANSATISGGGETAGKDDLLGTVIRKSEFTREDKEKTLNSQMIYLLGESKDDYTYGQKRIDLLNSRGELIGKAKELYDKNDKVGAAKVYINTDMPKEIKEKFFIGSTSYKEGLQQASKGDNNGGKDKDGIIYIDKQQSTGYNFAEEKNGVVPIRRNNEGNRLVGDIVTTNFNFTNEATRNNYMIRTTLDDVYKINKETGNLEKMPNTPNSTWNYLPMRIEHRPTKEGKGEVSKRYLIATTQIPKIGEDGKPVIDKETKEQVYETVDFYTPLTNKSKNKISQLLKAKDIDLDKELDRADNEALGRTTPTQQKTSNQSSNFSSFFKPKS